jgi:hypothetical protein
MCTNETHYQRIDRNVAGAHIRAEQKLTKHPSFSSRLAPTHPSGNWLLAMYKGGSDAERFEPAATTASPVAGGQKPAGVVPFLDHPIFRNGYRLQVPSAITVARSDLGGALQSGPLTNLHRSRIRRTFLARIARQMPSFKAP